MGMQLPTLSLPAIPHLSVSVVINLPILIGVLVVFFIVYCAVSSVVMYHWYSYGMSSPGILVAETLFFLVTVVMFMVSGLALSYI